MLRKRIITGNWKMHKTIDEALQFVNELLLHLQNNSTTVCLAVPFTSIRTVAEKCKGTHLIIGAQNMNDATAGAFTGEIAGKMLIDAGAKFVLLGHSERRHLFHETNDFINRKIKRALLDKLQPILCIGETQAEYNAEKTEEILKMQLIECLKDLQSEQLHSLAIAYEPIWAIGTGYSATPEIAEKVHQFIRNQLQEMFNEKFAQEIILQYGGSVTPSNATILLQQANIDGLLIGGASLSLETFCEIVNDSQLNQNFKGSDI